LDEDKSQVWNIDYKPHAFENSICDILSKRAKIEPQVL